MRTNHNAHPELIDNTRMKDAVATAGRSAEWLFGYYSRLDNLQAADLTTEALADRAFEAESNMRVVLAAGMDALNELHDLGLLGLSASDEEIEYFNERTPSDAVRLMATALREQLPAERWDWLDDASRLVEGVEWRIERDGEGYLSTLTQNCRTTVVRLDPAAATTRVNTRAFFSNGPDRVWMPTSAIFSSPQTDPVPVSAYDVVVCGFAFSREWVYRHARYAAEMGPPARTGGAPVVAAIVTVCAVAAAISAAVAGILGLICWFTGGEEDNIACTLAKFFAIATAVFVSVGTSTPAVYKELTKIFGTNPT